MPPPAQYETRVVLEPIAAPSALGLLAFAGATFLAGAHFAHWIPGPIDPLLPLLLALGGVVQIAAGMWGFKARDGLAAAIHTIWGAHWLGFGTLQLLVLGGAVSQPPGAFPALGWWYLVMGALMLVGVVAATGENAGILSMLVLLTGACVVMGLGQLLGSTGLGEAAGYLFAASAACALYTGAALMIEDVRGRPLLPVGRFHPAKEKQPITSGLHEPGVTRGQ